MSEINPIEGELMPAEQEYLSEGPFVIGESVDPLEVIKTTQTIRIAMVKNELKHGVPKVDKDSRDLMQLLRDLDGAALTTRKLDVEERQVDESQRMVNAQQEFLRMLGGKNPFAIDVGLGLQVPMAVRPDPNDLPEAPLVPDVTTQGTQSVDYKDFVSEVEASERSLSEDED